MQLNIEEIKLRNGSGIDYTLSETVEDVHSRHYDVVFEGPVDVKIHVRNDQGTLLLSGTAQGIVSQKCDRCLETYSEPFRVELSDTIYPAHRPVDELDFYRTYSGSLLDLDETIQEAVIVGMPITRLCGEDCRGICEGCGKNLNEESCVCESNPYNPRMEMLKKFFEDE